MAREWSCAVIVRSWSRATSIPPHPPVDLQLSQQQAPGKFTTLTQLFSVFPLHVTQPHFEGYSVLGYGPV